MATADDRREDADGEQSVDASAPGDSLAELDWVGPATAAVLADADVSVADVREKAVSYRDLVRAGVNPGVAGKLRREHSLHWTHDEQRLDLDRRSERVRGLRDGEREWVASTGGSGDDSRDDAPADAGEPSEESATASTTDAERAWVGGSTDGGPDERGGGPAQADAGGDAFAAEAAWRERAQSPPVTALSGVGRAEADRLDAVGVDTVRRLATADPSSLATRLGIPVERVREWRVAARERAE